MYRWLRCGLIASLLLLWIVPTQVLAYSYGDANTEDVAETFKLIEGELSEPTPNWKSVAEAYKTRRSEIKSHFGDDIAITLDKNIEAMEDKLLIANYKAVLVMNLERRFTYASKDVKDYAGSKLLLSKAKATFDTLAPYMSSGTAEINQAFEDALDALGNPGLFGVGKKDADPELFKEKVSFIHTEVKPLFPFKAHVASVEARQEDNPTPAKEATAAEQPVADKQTAVDDAKPATEAGENSSSSLPAETNASADENNEATAEDEPVAVAEAQSEAPAPVVDENVAVIAQTESESAGNVDTSATIEQEEQEQQEQVAFSEEHAPMERSSKTNSFVTIIVIGGVILLGGGALWFIRKKGLI